MELKDRLITGMKKEDVNLLVKEVLTSDELFTEMVGFATGKDRVKAMKAAWVLGHASCLNTNMANQFLNEWKATLDSTRVGGVQREMVKIMSLCHLPDEMAGWFLNKCFSLLQSPASEPASKYHSLMHIQKQTKKYPELKEELATILEGQLTWHTAAWRRYAEKIIAKLRKPVVSKVKK